MIGMNIEVTEADIKKARIECPTSPCVARTCPIAQALIRHGFSDPIVEDTGRISWVIKENPAFRESGLVSENARDFISAFDHDQSVGPISFTINEYDYH